MPAASLYMSLQLPVNLSLFQNRMKGYFKATYSIEQREGKGKRGGGEREEEGEVERGGKGWGREAAEAGEDEGEEECAWVHNSEV